MRVFSGVTHLSLSRARALRYATTTTTTTLTTQGRPRDVRETRVPVPERKDERSRATKSGLRDDVSSRRMHVRVDSFLVSLASPTFSLAFFFLSLERGARTRYYMCTNDGVRMPVRCVLTLARLHILRATQVSLDVQICLGARKTSLAETWDDPARLGKRPRGERRSHVENLRRGRIQPPLCLLRRSKNHEMETRSQTWRPSDQNG